MRGLQDKAVIVTGAGSGIGRAIAVRLAQEGCQVGIFDMNAEAALETAREITTAKGTVSTHIVDITDGQAVIRAVQEFEGACGPTSVLVNNAGWDQAMPFLKSTPDFWKKVIDINLYGPLNLHHAVLPGMAERKSGRVINIASDAGRVGSSGEAVYSACKGGIIAFGKTLARELARNNIQVNTICPGPTDTPLFATFASGDSGKNWSRDLRARFPWAGSDSRTITRGSWRFSRVTTQNSSPARPSASPVV